MHRISLLILLCSLTGCFRLTGIEHEVSAGFGRSQSGGEVYGGDCVLYCDITDFASAESEIMAALELELVG